MKKSRKLLAALLALLMLCSVLPLSVFAADNHTVRYVLNYYLAPKIASKTVADGETAPYVDGVERSGWYFAGWSLAKRGELYDFNTPVTEDITLYAQWTQNKSVSNAAMQNTLAAIAKADKPETDPTPDEEENKYILAEDSPYYFIVDVLNDAGEALTSFFYSHLPSAYTGDFVHTISSSRNITGTNQIHFRVSYKKGSEIRFLQQSAAKGESITDNLPLKTPAMTVGTVSDPYTLAYGTGDEKENRFYCTYVYEGKTYLFELTFACYKAAEWQLFYEVVGEYGKGEKIMFLTHEVNADYTEILRDTPIANIKFSASPWSVVTANGHPYYAYGAHPLAAGLNRFTIEFTPIGGEKQNILLQVQNGESDYVNPYTDITIEHPFYNEIAYCTQNGYMGGVRTDTFAPDNDITNEMLAIVLYRSAGSPESGNAGDSESAKAMAWAQKNGLFYAEAEPKSYVSRYALAYALLAYVKLQYPTFVYSMSGAYVLSDMAELSQDVQSTISFALSAGALSAFVSEKGIPTFAPDTIVQRAELARTVAALHQHVLYVLAQNPDGVAGGYLFK